MKKWIAVWGLALLAAPMAQAQGYLPGPVTNPFDRQPGSFFWNYQSYVPGNVYPGGIGAGRFTDPRIMQQLQLIQQQQQSLIAGQGGALGAGSLYAPTGHPVRFGSYSQYFMNYSGANFPVTPGTGAFPSSATQPGFLPPNVSRPGTAPVRPTTGARTP